MNLDLTALSKKELQDKLANCSNAVKLLYDEKRSTTIIYNKLLNKRWVKSVKLATIFTKIDNLELIANLVDEYSKVLLDESNRRVNLLKDKK